ncbi:MAG: transglycosylase SLT domain-containing protein [Pseudomonadota bacterium]
MLLSPAFADAADDADFIAAREAFRVGDIARLERLAPNFRHSPLEPYLTYYQLRLRLETIDMGVIQAFLARPDDTPLIDRLRGEWLKVLGKYQRWDIFAREYPALLGEDTELTCYALQARNYLEGGKALSEARRLWLSSGVALPDSCNPVFDDALAEGAISAADVWLRIRLALEGGNVSLARQLSERLPTERRLGAVSLSRAAADPERYLKRVNLENATEGQRLEALFALQRLAKQLPQLANRYWEGIAEYFTAAEQHYFYGWLGYEAARKQDARALDWYHASGEGGFTDAQRAWRVRAALRAQEWTEVLISIAAMPPQQQREGAWRYWKARALKALGRAELADKIFAPLSKEYNFYGQLAADELDLPVEPGLGTGYQPGSAELSSMAALPGIQRALALFRMDLRNDAMKEWAWAIRQFDDKQLLTAAEIARRNEIYDRAIYTADRTVQLHDFNLRYLAPYRGDLKGHIRQNGLEEAWVYGLMRQESRFVTQAKSNVGASGLMQVMPATARWLAAKLGMKDYRHSLISQMETNLKLGTYYMKTVLLSFDNNPVLASAAYNAGPARARQWRGETALEGAIYVETIPYDETRDYVKKVMSNTVYYAQLFGQPAARLKQRLGVIAPRNAAVPPPLAEDNLTEPQ